jgi:hypothetical protein
LDDLTEYGGNETTSKRATTVARFDELIQMPFHWLEHEVEFLALWKQKRIVQGYDVWMRGYCK